jgi:hypothetical protein
VLVYTDSGDIVEQRRIHTPAGDLTTIMRHSADMRVCRTVQRLFRSPADYAPLMAMLAAETFADNAAEYCALEDRVGTDVLIRSRLGYTPMHQIMHDFMGLETFAEEWSHRREEVLALYKALVGNRKRQFVVVANSPATVITYGGHLNAQEVGEDRFSRYYLPAYNEFADLMHATGKLVGMHVSGDARPLSDGLARSHADYIEGFRPTPELGLLDARKAWPDKAIWVEMPPDVHQRSLEDRATWIGNVLNKGRGKRFLLEVATNMTPDTFRKSMMAAVAATENSMKGKPMSELGVPS